METTKLVHYGKLLKLSMQEKGIRASRVMEILEIKAYQTLNDRFEDGAFSYDQLKVLVDKGIL